MHIAISKFAIAGPDLIRERERNIIILALSLNLQIIFQRAGDCDWVLAVAARAVEPPDLGLVVVEYVDFDFVARVALGFGSFEVIPLRQVQAAGPRCVGGLGLRVFWVVTKSEFASRRAFVICGVRHYAAVGGGRVVNILEEDSVVAWLHVTALPCVAARDDWEFLESF